MSARVPAAIGALAPVDAVTSEEIAALDALAVSPAPTVTQVRLRGGRTVEVVDDDAARVTITSPAGRVELRVRLTDDGPVLSFEQTGLTLSTRGALTLDCDDLRVRARRDVTMEAGRDVVHDARGEVDIAGGSVRMLAREGDATIESRGDARVDGARVLLNCAPGATERG